MPLTLTNTLTGKKEPFEPLSAPKVTMYACGVTVYDECHIGHARGAIVFDVLRRFLEHQEFQVTYVRNITDVDDKIIERARRTSGDLKEAVGQVAATYTKSFQEDFARLGLLAPSKEPKATEYIQKMISFIQQLMDQGAAYAGEDGVYFSVRKLSDYGKLSHQNPDQMQEGAHLDAGQGKQDPLDFALWKKAKPEEPAWDSPWGAGRPGWHIECSTMSTDLLGDQFDIHGGGQDLIFPHHENELAQAKGAGKSFARVWLHNGLLTVGGQKMSKSVGNIVTIGSVLKKHSAEVLRLFYLSAHYRSPIDFTWDRLNESAAAYERLYDFLTQVDQRFGEGKSKENETTKAACQKFKIAMEDDLNTPEALAAMFDLVTEALTWLQKEPQAKAGALVAAAATLRQLGGVLGLGFPKEEVSSQIQELVRQRNQAREKKDFEKADEIRKELSQQGYVLEDTDGGTVIRKGV